MDCNDSGSAKPSSRSLGAGPGFDLTLDWRTDYRSVADSYGYYVHNARLKEAVEALGVAIDSGGGPIAVHVAPAHRWAPVVGKFNVLFTAWEFDTITDKQLVDAAAADLIVVPASFLKEPFSRTGRPVEAVHLGVDPPPFDGEKRTRGIIQPGRRFRWLWCAAPNLRKGHDLLLQAWKGLSMLVRENRRKMPVAELYVKTTTEKGDGEVELLQGPDTMPIILDTRNLDRPTYWKMMKEADAFVYPTRGEGFGLTLAEAMAAGLPCLFPNATALKDYAVGFPIKTERGWVVLHEKERFECDVPCVDDMVEKMALIPLNYPAARRVGQLAARRMKKMTWEASARSFLAAVKVGVENRAFAGSADRAGR